MVRKIVVVGVVILIAAVAAGVVFFYPRKFADPRGFVKVLSELPLEKYDFDELRKRQGQAGEIEILGPIKAVEDRRKLLADKEKLEFQTREISFGSEDKKISGMINYYPEKSSLSPVIIMVRGYAEKAGYYPGSGTWRVADEFAKAGYTTISLDFLGYGNSEAESTDMLEARFHKVVEVLDLLAAVKRLPWVDQDRIGFWAHSNGGQIVLSVLEVTGGSYPTVLWAPMTNKFPESVLSTIDPGSPVEAAILEFERHYDARRYAFENYYQRINAPVLIQQGTNDEWCEVAWQQEVVDSLREFGKQAELVIYNGADHNLKGAWEEAVARDVEYYLAYLAYR